eukprot:2634205-Prorocentrum_lima.AAC.1
MGVDIHWPCGRCTNAGALFLQSFLPVRGAGRAKFASNAPTSLQTGPIWPTTLFGGTPRSTGSAGS